MRQEGERKRAETKRRKWKREVCGLNIKLNKKYIGCRRPSPLPQEASSKGGLLCKRPSPLQEPSSKGGLPLKYYRSCYSNVGLQQSHHDERRHGDQLNNIQKATIAMAQSKRQYTTAVKSRFRQ